MTGQHLSFSFVLSKTINCLKLRTMAEKRIGCQTPTKSYVLPYEKTLAPEAVDIYEQSGQSVLESQKLLLNDIMAVNEDGLWTHMTVGYSLPRRNGKTEVIYQRELWGLEHGESILHTAHRTNTSHASWDKLKRLLEDMGYEEKRDFASVKAKGSEMLELYDTGGRVFFRTRSGTGGLGEGFDLLVIDEAQEYTSDQKSALDYTISSSQSPQTIMCGTPPTAVSKGTLFEPYRSRCLSGIAEDSMWAEWSIEKLAADVEDSEFQSSPEITTDTLSVSEAQTHPAFLSVTVTDSSADSPDAAQTGVMRFICSGMPLAVPRNAPQSDLCRLIQACCHL